MLNAALGERQLDLVDVTANHGVLSTGGCDLARFADLHGVACQRRCLGGQHGASAFAFRRLADRLTNRLQSADATPTSYLVERAQALATEAERERSCRRIAAQGSLVAVQVCCSVAHR